MDNLFKVIFYITISIPVVYWLLIGIPRGCYRNQSRNHGDQNLIVYIGLWILTISFIFGWLI